MSIKQKILFKAILFTILSVFVLNLSQILAKKENASISLLELPERDSYNLFLKPIVSPYYISTESLGTIITDQNNSLVSIANITTGKGVISNNSQTTHDYYSWMLENIKGCECGPDPRDCNLRYGCIAGAGPCGFVSSTWNETLERMKKDGEYIPPECNKKMNWRELDGIPVSQRTHPVFSDSCCSILALWLLEQGESWRWDQSRHCWSPKL